MTLVEIVEIATQEYGECNWHYSALLRLEAFVKLVAAKEREACAKVCETRLGPTATDFYGKAYADAIRARTGDKND